MGVKLSCAALHVMAVAEQLQACWVSRPLANSQPVACTWPSGHGNCNATLPAQRSASSHSCSADMRANHRPPLQQQALVRHAQPAGCGIA